MTIQELFAQGVRKVHLPVWNKFAYLELQEVNGKLPTWGKLWDIGYPGRDIAIWQEKSNEFEEYLPLTDLSEDYIQSVYNNTSWSEQEQKG